MILKTIFDFIIFVYHSSTKKGPKLLSKNHINSQIPLIPIETTKLRTQNPLPGVATVPYEKEFGAVLCAREFQELRKRRQGVLVWWENGRRVAQCGVSQCCTGPWKLLERRAWQPRWRACCEWSCIPGRVFWFANIVAFMMRCSAARRYRRLRWFGRRSSDVRTKIKRQK